jgi:hypothetical protein
MEGQGIPMSEDEDAMQGMLPEGPAVAPEDIANQMQGRYGGSMKPKFPGGGESWFDMLNRTVYGNSYAPAACKPGYVYNSSIGECVTPTFKNVKQIYNIPYEAFQSNAQQWQSPPVTAAPKKKPTAADKKAQELFDKSFKIIDNGPTAYEKSKAEQARLIEEKRKKEGYYEKASQAGTLTKKVLEGNATTEEQALLKDLNNITPYFYDLEFSILFKQNTIKILSDSNPRVNLYLNLKKNFVLIKDFLHIFDYFLLTMSVISYHNNMNKINNFLTFVNKFTFKEKDAKILLFLYLYDKINYYFTKNNINITVKTMLDYCDYDTIYKILTYSYNIDFSYIEKNIKYIYSEINDLNQ